eukprot:scaffold238015_cov30-Prasinocladus_malaysianus.AAC.1
MSAAVITASKLWNGSPMPMKTTLVMGVESPTEVAPKPHAPREAKLTVHSTTQLAGDADGDPFLAAAAPKDWDQDRLDRPAGCWPLGDFEQQLPGAV